MSNQRFVLFLMMGFLLIGTNSCKKNEFSTIGYWNLYWDGDSTPVRYEFSGSPSGGTIVEVGALPGYQDYTYAVNGSQITIKFYDSHGIGWTHRTCTGNINVEEERMDGTYSGQRGGTPSDPVYDFSGTWVALKSQ